MRQIFWLIFQNSVTFYVDVLQVIEIGYVPSVRASRVSYVGELGWELYVPTEVRCNSDLHIFISFPHYSMPMDYTTSCSVLMVPIPTMVVIMLLIVLELRKLIVTGVVNWILTLPHGRLDWDLVLT